MQMVIYNDTVFIEASQNVVGVERKESFVVEQDGKKLSNSRATHLLVMVVLIDLRGGGRESE